MRETLKFFGSVRYWINQCELPNFLCFIFIMQINLQSDFLSIILQLMIQGRRLSISKRYSEKSQFIEQGLLGKGGSASVYKVRMNGELYALKRIQAYQIRNSEYAKALQQQITIMKNLDHPNIVKLYEVYQTENSIELLMQYMPEGTIFKKLKDLDHIPEYIAKKYMRDVLKAIEYLHSFPEAIIHRDLKPENLLIDKYGNVKLCDFGSAGLIIGNCERSSYVGTSEYMAPEMKDGKTHGPSLDIWCIGVLIYEMLVGKVPKETLIFPDYLSRPAEDLIKKILIENPAERLKLQQIKQHIWFVQEDYVSKIIRLSTQQPGQKLEQMQQRINQCINKIPKFTKSKKSIFSSLTLSKPTSSYKISQERNQKHEKYMAKIKKLAKLESAYKKNQQKLAKLDKNLQIKHNQEEAQIEIMKERIKQYESKIIQLKEQFAIVDSQDNNILKHQSNLLLTNLEEIYNYAKKIPETYKSQILHIDTLKEEPKQQLPISQYVPKWKLQMLRNKRNALIQLKMIMKRHQDMRIQSGSEFEENSEMESTITEMSSENLFIS